ncbi:MAG: hypothetical protein AB7R40_26495 [Nitrospiraceae bacterium]
MKILRTAFAVGSLAAGFFAGGSFIHRCTLGIEEFEMWAPFAIALASAVLAVAIKSYTRAVLAVAGLFLATYFVLAPAYLSYVHENEICIGSPPIMHDATNGLSDWGRE